MSWTPFGDKKIFAPDQLCTRHDHFLSFSFNSIEFNTSHRYYTCVTKMVMHPSNGYHNKLLYISFFLPKIPNENVTYIPVPVERIIMLVLLRIPPIHLHFRWMMICGTKALIAYKEFGYLALSIFLFFISLVFILLFVGVGIIIHCRPCPTLRTPIQFNELMIIFGRALFIEYGWALWPFEVI